MPNQQLFLKDLQLNCQAEILTDELSLGIYATDASVYQITPIAIVLPKQEVDVCLLYTSPSPRDRG